jgi:hypothetical protein
VEQNLLQYGDGKNSTAENEALDEAMRFDV